ncbi:hypothetical protein Desdi_0129 [Desulfitobacterium dichloroeliminans LMG P-21439]|uniref:Uncharacterized protein n=1 Tax=Desulfitobacterium dichloroeliminans (strain LMG P-21439 / DCA1) TaxID=871963 RepID=L0F1G4_DESDL|nr:hypothetical protein [Desulfitobacterium dichloroeliminans]AGA67689.1 hypothetical protein Desdi_0129 [Desulfitobacterium dichloroeliminans LMG P-21439]
MLNYDNDIEKRVTVILGPEGIGKTRELLAEQKRQESLGNCAVFIKESRVSNSYKELENILWTNTLLERAQGMGRNPAPNDLNAKDWQLVFLVDDCQAYDEELLKFMYDFVKNKPDILLILAGRNEVESKIKNIFIKANYKVIV